MTYGDIVRQQFKKHRGAVWCVRGLIVIFLMATYAPLIALDVPLWTSLEGASASPWLGALFDPTVFANAVDVFFNLLMLTLPIGVLLWFKVTKSMRLKAIAVLALVHLGTYIAIDATQENMRGKVHDYRAEVHAADASAVWPLVKHHPSGRQSQYTLTPPMSRGTLREGAPEPPDKLWPFFILGSDNLGNDVFTRTLYGTRISLTIGVIAVALYVTIGIILGAMAGYFGGWVDDLLMYIAQIVMVIPVLFLILFILSVMSGKPSIYVIMFIIAAVSWPMIMRLVRGEFLRQREIDYVTAARALGLDDKRVMFRHVVPNTLAPVFVSATFGVAGTILLESSLSFLGLGDPTAPSWGQLLLVGSENRGPGNHLIYTGGFAILGIVLLLNIIGEALRDALDPKLRQ